MSASTLYFDVCMYVCTDSVMHFASTTYNVRYNTMRIMTCILQINGKKIFWSHLENLYKAKENPGQGLHLLHKLKFEHVRLTSFSRMRVDLAAQVSTHLHVCYIHCALVVHFLQNSSLYRFPVKVLSESVAHALQFYGDPDTTETQRFVRTFDKFFDCLNVRSPSEYIKKRKENLQPYTSADDRRLCVSLCYYYSYVCMCIIEFMGIHTVARERLPWLSG